MLVIKRKYEWGNHGKCVSLEDDCGEKYEGLGV